MMSKKVHSVIPAPDSKSLTEKLGLDNVNLTVSLSDDTKEELTATREVIQEETRKTRMVLIVLGILNAFSFFVGRFVV